jgi:histidinol-phosphate aminotransferase
LDLGSHQSLIRQVAQRENLVVLRTFSKWAGLAGLRIGYGAFPIWLTNSLWKAKQPYNVNLAANAAALASLQDCKFLADNVAKIQTEREILIEKLKRFPQLTPFPSQSNFVLCKTDGVQAKEIKTRLIESGIFIRHYDSPLLKDCLRISVGKTSDTSALINQLEKIL